MDSFHAMLRTCHNHGNQEEDPVQLH